MNANIKYESNKNRSFGTGHSIHYYFLLKTHLGSHERIVYGVDAVAVAESNLLN